MTEVTGSIGAPGPLEANEVKETLEEKLNKLKQELIDIFESALSEYVQQVEINEEIQNYFESISNITNIIGRTYVAGTGIEIAGTKIHQYNKWRAITTEAGGADNEIVVNIYDRETGIEVTSGFGYQVTVYCDIVNGSALNDVIPRLESGAPIEVSYLIYDNSGTPELRWFCPTIFQTTEDCECTADTLEIGDGGTGATSSTDARANLGALAGSEIVFYDDEVVSYDDETVTY